VAWAIGCGFSILASCSPFVQVTSQVKETETGVRIMPLGDSITQGDRNHNSYRRPLWLKLRNAGYNVNFVGSTKAHYLGNAPNSDFDQDHEGRWGWQVDEVLGQIDQWMRNAKPDIVLIHLGTNDISRGQSFDSTIDELGQLIRKIRKQQPNVKILLAQLIPATNSEELIQPFNQRIVTLARSLSTSDSPVIAVDQFSGFNPSQDTYDGWHPNDAGEQKMAARWFEALRTVLPSRR
jgi:lysophospholipase L1-like esterase